jgi:Holliday junction resolvase-like predicted endonuclease
MNRMSTCFDATLSDVDSSKTKRLLQMMDLYVPKKSNWERLVIKLLHFDTESVDSN